MANESQIIKLISETLPITYKSVIDKFYKCINSELEIPFEEQFKYLLKAYCTNCGVSYGYRSVYYDFASTILNEHLNDEFADIDDYANKYINDWEKFKKYDAGMTIEPTIITAFNMLFNNEVEEKKWVIFCDALNKFIKENEDYIEKDLLLLAFKGIQ